MKSFLKKKKSKVNLEPKQISQAKMNFLFVGLFSFFVLVCFFTMISGVYRVFSASSTKGNQSVVVSKTDEVDNRLQLFLGKYIETYFNFDSNSDVDYTEQLNTFYNFVPKTANQGQSLTNMSLKSYKLDEIKDKEKVALYHVTYETEGKTITVLFGIPFGGKDGQYYVSGLPFYQAVKDYKSTQKDKGKELTLDADDDLSDEDRKELISFLELFFKNYTSSQENLDVISKGIRSIYGVEFKSIDYSYFKVGKKKITAYVQATFSILGNTHSENFTFEITKKNGSYFVETLSNQIPTDYSKK